MKQFCGIAEVQLTYTLYKKNIQHITSAGLRTTHPTLDEKMIACIQMLIEKEEDESSVQYWDSLLIDWSHIDDWLAQIISNMSLEQMQRGQSSLGMDAKLIFYV